MSAIPPVSSPFLDLYPLLPHHGSCSTPHGLAGLAPWPSVGCVQVGAVPTVSFCVERWGPSRSQVHPQPSKVKLPRAEELVSLDFRHLTWPSLGSQTLAFPPYAFGWETAGMPISPFPPFSTWVASVVTLWRFL